MTQASLSPWQICVGERTLTGIGNAGLLEGEMTAFFSSRQCPGVAIRSAMDWAVSQAKAKQPVISGFHSPLERSVLEVLLVAKAPGVVVLARDASKAKLPPKWLAAAKAGAIAIIGPAGPSRRLVAEQSEARNELVAVLAKKIIVAYASPDGMLSRQIEGWRSQKPIAVLADNPKGT